MRSATAKCILSQTWGQAMMLSIHILMAYQVSLQMRAAIPVVKGTGRLCGTTGSPRFGRDKGPCAEVQAGKESAWHSSDDYCPLSKISSLPVAHKLQA